MQHIDLTIQPSIAVEVKAPVLFYCPYPGCGRAVRSTQRMNYPPAAVGVYAPVYRCLCGKFIGAPVAVLRDAE